MMQTTIQTVGRPLALAVLLMAMLLLGVSCGSSGDESSSGAVTGSTPTGGYTPDTTGTTPLPGGTPGTPPPSDADGPADGDPGDNDPGDNDPGDNDPGDNDPGDNDPGDDDEPTPGHGDKRRSWEGFENVVAVATDPYAGTVWAVNHETGQVYRKLADVHGPEFIGIWNPAWTEGPDPAPSFARGPVRGLAFRTPDAALLAVIDRGPNDPDELIAIDPGSLEAVMIGPIGDRIGIESLAWNEAQSVLYAVDVDKHELVAIAGDEGDVLAERELDDALGAVDGLAADDAGRCLYGSVSARGVIYRFAMLNVGANAAPPEEPVGDPAIPAVQLMGRTADGKMQGLAFLPSKQFFYGVDPEQETLFLSDVMGHEIHAADFLAMAFCAEDGLLYASDASNERLVGIQPGSGWKHVVGETGVALLDGLAPAEEGVQHLYGISSATQMLYRVGRHDGRAEEIAPVRGPGAPWMELRSLAYGRGRLYAVDALTSDLLRIDAATGAAESIATLGRARIQSLAYQEEGKLLHAYSDKERVHLLLPVSTPENTMGVIPCEYPSIGGLAWQAAEDRLWASDLRGDQLTVLYETPQPPRLAYETVHALTWNHEARLLGGDLATGAVFEIDAFTQDTTEWLRLLDADIEAMAADADTGRVFLSDTNGPFLLVVGPDGVVDYVRDPAPPHAPAVLSTDGIKAMAWDPLHGVLFGVDLNGAGGATLVLINPATGWVTAFPQPIGYDTVEALAWNPLPWDPLLVRLLAIDRATRTLIEINLVPGDPDAGRGYPIGFQLPEGLSDVRGAALAPHDPSVLHVVDAAEGRVSVIDSDTGEVIR